MQVYANVVSTHYQVASTPKYVTKNIQLVTNSRQKRFI